jgi:uncharacterized protein YjdB
LALLITILLLVISTQIIRAQAPTPPPGTYSTSWLGNSFMNFNGRQVVTELINDICVSPNGVVFSAGYAESWGGGASYKASDGSFAGRYQRSETGFGDPLSCVAATDQYVYFGAGPGILRAKHGGVDGVYTVFKAAGGEVSGLYIKGDKLYASSANNNKIYVLKLSDMSVITSWNCDRPRHLTVDKNDNVWVVIHDPASPGGAKVWGEKIRSFSPSGVPGPEITFDKPCAVAVDKDGLLLVGGWNENSQIWKYDVSGATPTKVGTFGEDKGIFGGAVSGAFTNSAKLYWIRSIQVDADNNIYTSCGYGTFWGGSIEKWTPSGTLLWRDFAGTSLDCAGIDPYNETEVYSKYHHYSLDYSKTTPGTEWSLKGYTVNQFKYPNDIRIDHLTDVGSRSLGAGAYRIGGKLFVARSHQEGYECELFRQDFATDGEVLVPSVMMATGSDANNHFYNSSTKTWYDRPKKEPSKYSYGSWNIAKNGDLFTVIDGGKFVHYKFGGLDANNNPLWEDSNAETIVIPELSALSRIAYDSDNDVMYLAGDFPENGTNYNSFLTIKKFPNWSTGNRTSSATATLPYNDSQYTAETSWGGGMASSIAQAGNYFFILYGYGHIRILKKSDLSLVGTLKQNCSGWPGSGGQVDSHFGLTAFKRLNGEYVLMFENAAWANIMIQRWCPGDCSACEKIPVTNFGIIQETESLNGKELKTLTAEILPQTACRTIIWKSSNPSVASVEDGKITGISIGTTNISASIDNGSFTDFCTVTVDGISVASVTLSKDTLELSQLGKEVISVAVLPENALNKAVEFKTLDSNIATVDVTGRVEALSPGQTLLIVKSVEGNKSDTCVVIVTELKRLPLFSTPMNIPGKIEAENFDIGIEGLSYHDTDPTNNSHAYRLNDGVDIDSCGDKDAGFNVGWINANEWLLYYVNVESGIYDISVRVAALSNKSQCSLLLNNTLLSVFDVPVTGDWQKYTTVSKLNVPLNDGKDQTLKVIMNTGGFNLNYMTFQKSVPVESFSLETDTLELKFKGTYTFNPTILPGNTSRTGVNWSSGNTNIFTVDLWGNVTAKSVLGEAYLYAKSIDGIHQDSCLIKVVTLTGINEDLTSKIQVYPNPTSKAGFTISGLPDGNAIIKITTLNGQLVYTQKVYTSGNLHITHPKIPKGLYILSIQQQGQIVSKKLVVN